MKMSNQGQLQNRVKRYRQQRGWSQEELARRAGISRAAGSAIEIHRLVPSVAAALALAAGLGCRVEDLFGADPGRAGEEVWAWPPASDPCRFWRASAGGRVRHYPVENTAAGLLPHDGVLHRGTTRLVRDA